MPWPWSIARYCLELPYGSVRHFPAGTYDSQMATEAGRIELDLMMTVHSAWYTFIHSRPGDWKDSERKFAAWVAHNPKPQPTRRLDYIIEMMWGISYWVIAVMENMRGKDG